MITSKTYPGQILPNYEGKYVWYKRGDAIYDIDTRAKIKDVNEDNIYLGRITVDRYNKHVYLDDKLVAKIFYTFYFDKLGRVFFDYGRRKYKQICLDGTFGEEVEDDDIFPISNGWYFNFEGLGSFVCHNETNYFPLAFNLASSFIDGNRYINYDTIHIFHVPYKITRRGCDTQFCFS